ncbi:MAG: hypothetical protein KJ646_04600 [Nanoarchaeota archaeon]|nr:hypothetical protein [Nanoarchaeota archaeon]MBU4116506.1 hypothetical protein [Nanoarchaeota archaeon]
MNKKDSQDEINEEMKRLVIARIEAQISPNLKLSIGSRESLDKNQMIEHVMKGDDVGKQIIQVHLNFIKAQASGQLASALSSV